MHERIPQLKEKLGELLEQSDSWELHGELRRLHTQMVRLLFEEDVNWDETGDTWTEYRLLDERVQIRLQTLQSLKPKTEPPLRPKKLPPHPRKINLITGAIHIGNFVSALTRAQSQLGDALGESRGEAHILNILKNVLPYLLLEEDTIEQAAKEDPQTYDDLSDAMKIHRTVHHLAVQAYESHDKSTWIAIAHAIVAITDAEADELWERLGGSFAQIEKTLGEQT